MVETLLGMKKQQGVVVKTLVKFSEKVDFTFLLFFVYFIFFLFLENILKVLDA